MSKLRSYVHARDDAPTAWYSIISMEELTTRLRCLQMSLVLLNTSSLSKCSRHRPRRSVHVLTRSATAIPVFFSSSAGNRLFHTEGERAVASVAAQYGIPYSLSTLSSTSIEDIADLNDSPKFFQLYVWKDRGLLREMLDRAKEAEFAALILTVDFPITGNRERDLANGFTIPPKIGARQVWQAFSSPAWTLDYCLKPAIRYANLSSDTPAKTLAEFVSQQMHPAFSWRDAEWLLGEWTGPSAIRGVVRPDDAETRSRQALMP